MKASARIKEKRVKRFSTLDFLQDCEQWSFAVFQKLQAYQLVLKGNLL